MQKISTSPALYSSLTQADHHYQQRVMQTCTPQFAQLLASSRADNAGQLQWCSPLLGSVSAFTALSVVQQQQLRARLAQQQQALVQRVEQLHKAGQGAQAQDIQQVLQAIDIARIYSVGGQPVLVDWYGAHRAQAAPLSIDVAADNVASAMAASAARAANQRAAPRSARWPWLFGGTLTVLIIAIVQLWK